MARKPKWQPISDPLTDLETNLLNIRTISQMLIIATDAQETEHVDFLISLLPRHAGIAVDAFEKMMDERRANSPPPAPPPERKPPSPELAAAMLRVVELGMQEAKDDK